MSGAAAAWGGAAPRWCTPRDPAAPTYGPAVLSTARALGWAPMPWQRHVAEVMGEYRLDDRGVARMRYPVVVLIVPRRAGKTALTLPTLLQRAMLGRDRRCWYTAQTGTDAATTFRDEWVPRVRRSPLAPFLRARLSNGSMGLLLPDDLGSMVGLFAPTETALHGQDADAVVVDEAWSPDEVKGAQLEAAIRPTMLTRPARQLVIVSAGPTEDSSWLLGYRALGRDLVERGACADAGVCYAEWYPPGDLDERTGDLADRSHLDDPAVWAATHPAIGHTIDLDVLRQDRATMPADLFYRGTLNVTAATAGERTLPADAWDECTTGATYPTPARGGVAIGYAVDVTRTRGACAVAWALPDGRRYAELVEHAAHPSAWMPGRLDDLRRRHRGRLIAQATGPTATVTAALERRGVPVEALGMGEWAAACASLVDDLTDRRLVLYAAPQLDTAAAGVAARPLGDGFVFTQRRSTGDVSPVLAVTAALAGTRSTRARPVDVNRLRFAAR